MMTVISSTVYASETQKNGHEQEKITQRVHHSEDITYDIAPKSIFGNIYFRLGLELHLMPKIFSNLYFQMHLSIQATIYTACLYLHSSIQSQVLNINVITITYHR